MNNPPCTEPRIRELCSEHHINPVLEGPCAGGTPELSRRTGGLAPVGSSTQSIAGREAD